MGGDVVVAQYEGAHDRGFLCKIFLFTKPSLLDAYLHCVYTAKTQYRKFKKKYSQERNCAATVPILTFKFLGAFYIFL